jgi:hypothetical protein
VCTGEDTQYTFFPDRRWSYSAHFFTYPDVPNDEPYYIREMTVTAVPELDSLALSLAGMTGLGCFGFFRRWRPL